MSITEQIALEGAWWAMEQCGRVLKSATLLYNAGDYSNAIVLAMTAREELGRSKLLREIAADIAKNKTKITASERREKLKDHVEKQAAASVSVTIKNDSRLTDPMRRYTSNPVGSAEWKKARAEMDALVAAKAKKQPAKRHSLRMRSQYVDIDKTGSTWLLPSSTAKAVALDGLQEAVGDYAVASGNLGPNTIKHGNVPMERALAKMKKKPTLPNPVFPDP